MLNQVDSLVAVCDSRTDTNDELLDFFKLSIDLDKARYFRLANGMICALNSECRAYLKVVTTIACPILISQEEASVNFGRNAEFVPIGTIHVVKTIVLHSCREERATCLDAKAERIDPTFAQRRIEGWV